MTHHKIIKQQFYDLLRRPYTFIDFLQTERVLAIWHRMCMTTDTLAKHFRLSKQHEIHYSWKIFIHSGCWLLNVVNKTKTKQQQQQSNKLYKKMHKNRTAKRSTHTHTLTHRKEWTETLRLENRVFRNAHKSWKNSCTRTVGK